MDDDVLHIDTNGHISVSHRHDYLRQRVLQLFGNIVCFMQHNSVFAA